MSNDSLSLESNDPRSGLVLEFRHATSRLKGTERLELRAANLQLAAGQVALVRLEPDHEAVPLADLAEGLCPPNAGEVCFLGTSWTELDPDQADSRRAHIGRVFDGHAWISNLTVLENLTLSQRYHTRRPVSEIVAEVEAMARAFGFSEAPKSRIAGMARRDLRRAEWIRAFLAKPRLILLERPTSGVAVEHVSLLVQAIQRACQNGTAVLWTTDEERIWKNPGIPGIIRWTLEEAHLERVKETA